VILFSVLVLYHVADLMLTERGIFQFETGAMEEIHLPSALRAAAKIVIPAQRRVFSQGQLADHLLLVSSGSVKVFARSSEGREVVLYRVQTGEMCTLTTACLLGHTAYPAESITETETVAIKLPADQFDRLLNQSDSFRRFVFAGFSSRLAEIMKRFEQLLLDSVHRRLADFLLQRRNDEGVVGMTHEMLAQEIGTAREVVSRHLKTMEQEGMIRTRRGQIEILQTGALRNLA
jgi:CRP/FNR family transcriptional regulator